MFNGMPPKTILLIATQQIGDVLLCTPLLKSMREAWPNAVIDVLVYRNTSGILQGNGDCNAVIASDNHPSFSSYFSLIKRIFRRYDLAVTTQGNDRAHQYAFLAAKIRVGLIPSLAAKHWWKKLICQRWSLLNEATNHTVVQNLLLADLMGIARNYAMMPPKSTDSASKLNELINLSAMPYVVIHPLPMWQYKRWLDSNWQALIKYACDLGLRVVITGGPTASEQTFCTQLANAFANTGLVKSLAGKTSFADMSALLSHAAAYVGPDTATTHLAAACNTPTLALFGSTNPVKWAPWPFGYCKAVSPWQTYSPLYQRVNNVLLLQGLGACVPCHQAGCDKHNNSHSRCLDELSVSRVIDALDVLLGEKIAQKTIPIYSYS